jgi:cyclic pyranopterin phosphate synthase
MGSKVRVGSMTAIIKPGYSDDRHKLKDVIPLKTPYVVQFAPSSLCNLRCNYCIQSSKDIRRRQLMKWSVFLELCNQMKQFDEKLKQVNVAGWGEPLTNWDLPAMITHIRELDVTEKIAITTNGLFLTEGFTQQLLDAGVDSIRISLQGMSDKKYQEVSNTKINFKQFVENIKYLYQHKKNCYVYIKVADIGLEEGEAELFYNTFREITDAMYIETIRPMFGIPDEKDVNKYGQHHKPVLVCPQPFFMLNVTATGDITPCCGYYDPTEFGNITNTTLRKVWESPKMAFFKDMLFRRERNGQMVYPICNKCTLPDAISIPGDELD